MLSTAVLHQAAPRSSFQLASPPLPGLLERVLVIVAIFVFYHQTPNAWFVRAEDFGLDYSNSLGVLVQLGLIAIAFIRVAGYFDKFIELLKLEPTVFLFAGLTVATLFWSADPSETLRRSIIFAAVTIFASYLVLRFALDQIVTMLAVMFTVSGVLNLGFILQYPSFGIDAEGRWSGVFAQKNALGYIAALAIPTLLIAARTCRPARPLFYAAAVLQVVLLIRSDSKTMLVAAFGPVLLLPFFHWFRARRTLRGAVVTALTGSSLLMLIMATANVGLLASWLDKDVSLTGRAPLWEALIPIIGERFWLGHGYGAAFGGFFSPVHNVWIYNQWAGDAHNAYIQIWLEVGVIGVLLFIWSYIRATSRATRIVAIVPGAVGLWPLAILSATLLVSITESGIQSDSMGWTLYLVAVLSVSAHLKHRTKMGLSNDLVETTVAKPEPELTG